MEGAPKGQEQQNATTQWDTLTNPVKVEKKEDQNWDPRLTEEQVDELWAEGITPKDAEYGPALYNYGLKPSNGEAEPKDDQSSNQDNDETGERSKDKVVGTFSVGYGTPSKEEQFKQITGEDWPGVNYYAYSYGVEDDGYDNPIENWTIYELVKEEPTPGEDPNKTPEPEKDPEPEEDPEKPGEKKPEDDEKKNKVDLDTGDKLSIIQEKIDEEKIKRKEELEVELKKLIPDIAELYARNRRLIVGAENRAKFNKIKGRYAELLDEYLKLKAETTYEQGRDATNKEVAKRVEELNKEIHDKLLEFVGGDPENTDKTQKEVDDERARLVREAADKLNAEYQDMMTGVEAKVNAEFLSDYIKQQKDLEDATIDALDNGTMCRKFVSKVINNKHLKKALLVAGAVGLAVTGVGLGVGLATGAMTVGLSFTAGGVAAGAARGGLSGMLMSRQSSKNSAVRGFASEEEIIKKLQNVNVLDKNSDTANVASWIMEQYGSANTADAKSNKKRTAISAGIGAIIGGVTSGIQINNVETTTETIKQQTGTTPVEYKADLSNVDIPKGFGQMEFFRQAGGNPEDYSKWENILNTIGQKYGAVPGSNGETVGLNGLVGKIAHTYPGKVADWPDVARAYIEEVSAEAAKQGLIPAIKTGGQPIFDMITRTVTQEVPNAFMNFLARGTGFVVAGAAGRAIGEKPNRIDAAEGSPEEPVEEPVEEPSGEGETPALNNPETPDEKREAFKAEIEQTFGDSIGENGSTIMSNNEALGFTQLEAIRNWWQSLSDDTRQKVSDFMAASDPSNGQTLRIWLSIIQSK